MKKIGIVTINGDYNYGNRLQNYALEQAIKSLGFEVETVVFPEKRTVRDYLREFKRGFNKKYRIEKRNFTLMSKLKSEAFLSFRQSYLNNVKYNRNEDLSNFDRFIVGSDQVWNPSWRLIDDYWLRFTTPNKRFSYAASMATSIIHSANTNKLPLYLQEMNEISVREFESVHLIESISGKKAKLVVDPTMLLQKKDYVSLINQKDKSKVDTSTPYILIYTLEGLTKELDFQVRNISSEKGWRIMTVMGNKYHEDHEIFNPIEFIEAIKDAELVISDSFHCGVFSILMESPFALFNRVDGAQMSSRITTLLSRFNMEKHFYQGGNLECMMNIDYVEIRKKIDEARMDSLNYLKFILNKSI